MYFDPSEPGAAFRAADQLAARLMPHIRLVCPSRKRTKKKNRKSWNHPITVKGVPALSVVFQMSLAFSETVRVTCCFSYSSIVPLCNVQKYQAFCCTSPPCRAKESN
jgi:hypothetical protein